TSAKTLQFRAGPAALSSASASRAPVSLDFHQPSGRQTRRGLRRTRTGASQGGVLIARIWKGAVREQDGDAYADYMQKTGIAGYTSTPGNAASRCSAATLTSSPSS